MKYIVTRQVLPYDAFSLDLGHGGLGQLGLFGSPLEKVPNNIDKENLKNIDIDIDIDIDMAILENIDIDIDKGSVQKPQ